MGGMSGGSMGSMESKGGRDVLLSGATSPLLGGDVGMFGTRAYYLINSRVATAPCGSPCAKHRDDPPVAVPDTVKLSAGAVRGSKVPGLPAHGHYPRGVYADSMAVTLQGGLR